MKGEKFSAKPFHPLKTECRKHIDYLSKVDGSVLSQEQDDLKHWPFLMASELQLMELYFRLCCEY